MIRLIAAVCGLAKDMMFGHDYDRPIPGDEPYDTYGYEPDLTDSELVGVRELLERFDLAAHSPRVAGPAAGSNSPDPAAGPTPHAPNR